MSPRTRQRNHRRSDENGDNNSVNKGPNNRGTNNKRPNNRGPNNRGPNNKGGQGKGSNNNRNRNRNRKPNKSSNEGGKVDNRLSFVKMHGLGNDFLVLDMINQPLDMTTELVRRLADRHTGIGCDQLLLIEAPTLPDADFRYRIFNADGQEVEHCGNGARCFAKYVVENKLTGLTTIKLQTGEQIITVSIVEGGVAVDMGQPNLEPSAVALDAERSDSLFEFKTKTSTLHFDVASMGNPHAVVNVEDTDTAAVAEQGEELQASGLFANGVNVGFMQVVERDRIKLRVFERGVGETRACGTGACAAVACGIRQGLLDSSVTVELPGGELTINWPESDASMTMTGPATKIFDGKMKL